MSANYPFALSFQRYREVLDADYRLLHAGAPAALARQVPACPGWIGEDLIRHTAQVYLHKAESIRTGTMPREGWPPSSFTGLEAMDALQDGYRRLTEQFSAHRPEDAAETWWPADQTVGFWLRRMAQETAIHRYDIEAATSGRPATASDKPSADAKTPAPIDSELALDGIDEVLDLFLAGDWSEEIIETASGSSVGIESGGHGWTLTLNPAEVRLERQRSNSIAGNISGEPEDVLLWLWGRAPLPQSSTGGHAVDELRTRLALATE